MFQVRRLFPMVSYYLFWCFSILVNYYFKVSFNSNVTLYVYKITLNNVTEFLLIYALRCKFVGMDFYEMRRKLKNKIGLVSIQHFLCTD